MGKDQYLGGFASELRAALLGWLVLGQGEDFAHARAEHHTFDSTDLFGTRLGKAAGLCVAGQLGVLLVLMNQNLSGPHGGRQKNSAWQYLTGVIHCGYGRLGSR
ncbi:hypothetical protein HJA87_31010 [Rhizobium bangladeshense]|uniref:Uncharacterized protein n=1 Tax=Rhizobium bangladeshense TaxID=1138189 RepID=A0ABS7LS11_9HYPH|nr:hypothetical protein [Rhizobium bangladeshense]MBX4876978.1 hypothetical protein [Rhizobium bangladeshense]MBX4887980.1 hypothetical protein [Rhizobium bangladeshense]MBY3594239.1 hypothetical protein [Rhizobium bangladeshense]MBY3600049.1 hypothetical protein [Rhizobium bangladeshense]